MNELIFPVSLTPVRKINTIVDKIFDKIIVEMFFIRFSLIGKQF